MADMPVYVINLATSSQRRESISRQAEEMALRVEFVTAVDGSKPHPLFTHVDPALRQSRKGRPFRAGEMGCWASHYQLWQRCVERGAPIIVLEDDVTLKPGLPDLLKALPLLPDGIEYFRLHAASRPGRTALRFGQFQLYQYWRSPMCAFGYYLTPAAAQRFLRHARQWVLAVDDYMDQAWLHGVECLGLAQGVVSNQDEFASVICAQPRPRVKLGLRGWASRESYRAWLRLRSELHNLPLRWQLDAPKADMAVETR